MNEEMNEEIIKIFNQIVNLCEKYPDKYIFISILEIYLFSIIDGFKKDNSHMNSIISDLFEETFDNIRNILNKYALKFYEIKNELKE